MRHPWPHAQTQLPLGLGTGSDVDGEARLRTAFGRLDISRRMSYEQAMADRACAIGIRNFAEAVERRRRPRSGHRRRACR